MECKTLLDIPCLGSMASYPDFVSYGFMSMNEQQCLSFSMQIALRSEPGRRQSMGRQTFVASQELIRIWNKDKTSDAVVLFLRALAAFYMLQNPELYGWRLQTSMHPGE